MALKRLGVVSLVCLVASLVLASSAFATEWSSANTNWSGTLTFKRNGGNPSSCTISGPAATSEYSFNYSYYWTGKCSTGATATWTPAGWAYYEEGHYFLEWYDVGTGWHSSPWPNREWGSEQVVSTVPFTNGSGSTPSKVKFNENVVDITNFGETVTVSGELSVSYAGKAVTLSGE